MMFWFPLPGKEAEVQEIRKAWLELHKSKNVPGGYETYKTVFGGEPGYVFVWWGKDQLDYLTKAKKNSELAGDEGAKLWAHTMAITQKIYRKNGWFMPGLSYSYQTVPIK